MSVAVPTNAAQVLPVMLERTDRGVRITSPALPGWSCAATALQSIGACLDAAWTELQIASYAALRGAPYDAAHLAEAAADPEGWARQPDGSWTSPTGIRYAAGTPRAARREQIANGEGLPATRRVTAADGTPIWRLSHDPADWTPLPGGDWRSPGGHRYRRDSKTVGRIIARRRAMNLPVSAPETG